VHDGFEVVARTRTVVNVSRGDLRGETPAELADELARLRTENARLLRLLKLTRREAAPPGPAQAGFFEAPPGPVHAGSPPEAKVAFFGALFAARTDIYGVRWDNARTGQKGWLPAGAAGGARASGTPTASTCPSLPTFWPLTRPGRCISVAGEQHLAAGRVKVAEPRCERRRSSPYPA
jgi:hypothetical protein